MKRQELATFTLLATAIVLAGLVLMRASRLIESRAEAEMAITKNSITMLTTANPQGDGEILYILDSRSGQLYAYELSQRGQEIELFAALDLTAAFNEEQAEEPRGRRQR